jgi:hypothetical protein
MLRNMLFAFAVATIVAPGAMTTEAIAGSSEGREQDAHSAAYSTPQQRRWHVAHRSFTHGFGGYYGSAVLPRASAFRVPGYIYVPGIVDGACNLPTSACSNEFRNVN